VEEEDVGRHLLELAVLGVKRALRRASEQAEHERGHGRDQAHPHLYDVLRLGIEMMLGQDGPAEHAEQRSAEDAHEGDPGDFERRHLPHDFPSLMPRTTLFQRSALLHPLSSRRPSSGSGPLGVTARGHSCACGELPFSRYTTPVLVAPRAIQSFAASWSETKNASA